MSYIDVIPLATAKEYLRVDDSHTEDDAQITRMIGTALAFVEKWTNHIVYARDKDYLLYNGSSKIFEYPINSVVSPNEAVLTITEGISHTQYNYSEQTVITLNVGYVDSADVPDGLIDVALEVIDIYYYGNDTGKTVKDLSPMSVDVLNQHKRHLL